MKNTIVVELKLKEIENLYGVHMPRWMFDGYCAVYNMITGMIIDRINLKLAELNEKAKRLGLEGSFDLDAPYNKFLRNEEQKIADEFMAEVTGGSKVYSGNGMEYSFRVGKDFMFRMDIYSENYGIRQELYPVVLEES